MKVFVPFSEELLEKLGLEMGDLVPFDLDYECLRTREDSAANPIPLRETVPEST
jgi:hypothetical protein